jgi:L-iditol 2-dehydrogenase
LLLTDYGKLTVTDVPTPGVAPDEVLVRVRACGVCGSDVHGFDGSTGRRIPPLIMGHEAAGIVEAVGDTVREFGAGDRVTFDSTVSCGRCDYCARGQINLCDNRMILGVSCADYRRHGAFAEYVSVPARIVYRLPDALQFEQAAMIEALSVAVHAVARRPPRSSDAVVVIGCGMIGLLIVQVLRHRGCDAIVAVDVDSSRRALAERLGASSSIDARSADVPVAVREATDGRGADLVLEAVGRTATIQAAVRSVRKGGAVTLVGNLTPEIALPLQEVVTRELSLLGSCASSGEYPECIDLLASGAVDVAPLITATAPLEDGPAWFDRLHSGDEFLMKVVLQP